MENSLNLNREIDFQHRTSIRQLRTFGSILIFILLSTILSGCVSLNDPELSQEYSSESIGVIDSQTTISQCFKTHRPNLNSITIWLTLPSGQSNTQPGGIESLNVSVIPDSLDESSVFTTTVFVSLSDNVTPFTIQIPNKNIAEGSLLFLHLSASSAAIQINGRNEDAYPDGHAYINNEPVSADIAFRTSYDYGIQALLSDLKRGTAATWIVFPLLIVLWLPGWLLLEFSGARHRFDFGEQCALSIGLSLSITPILMLWTTIFKIHWSRIAVLWLSGFLAAFFILYNLYHFIVARKEINNQTDKFTDLPQTAHRSMIKFSQLYPLALLLIFVATTILRFVMVRDLATPAWVDSVHHALLTRLILTNGGYPSSLLPYLDIAPASYHIGYHSVVAFFTWLSNLSVDKALLIVGQVLNSLIVFSIYLFTKQLTHSAPAGLIAASITGFLTPMPAYYASWGRYTELAGLIILPAAFILISFIGKTVDARQRNWLIILAAITSAGLFMVHYRVVVFLSGLLIAYLFIHILFGSPGLSYNRLTTILQIMLVAAISMIFVSPWLLQTIKSAVLPVVNHVDMNTTAQFQVINWAYLTSALGKYTLIVCGFGFLWGVFTRKRFPYLLLVWISALFLLANLGALKLPGAGLVSSLSVEIMLFMPISILGGYFVDQVRLSWVRLIPSKLAFIANGLLIAMIILTSNIGSRQLANIINPVTILSRAADLQAIDWVSHNIPETQTIVINPFAWGYGVYAGSDGGYWISPLSGRTTFPPPVLYGLGKDAETINSECQKLIESSSNPAELREFMLENHFKYIFTGAKGGIFSPDLLSASGDFKSVYHQDGVWILMLTP